MITIDEIALRFNYHAPFNDQADRYEMIRARGYNFARLITEICPESRELALALTKLEEAVMWANAAIARREQHLMVASQE